MRGCLLIRRYTGRREYDKTRVYGGNVEIRANSHSMKLVSIKLLDVKSVEGYLKLLLTLFKCNLSPFYLLVL